MEEHSRQCLHRSWSKIAEIRPPPNSVNVRFQVLEKSATRVVRARSSGRYHEVCDLVVADETGSIKLTLWNDDIGEVELGKTFEMIDGYVKILDECMLISKGRKCSISASQEAIHDARALPDMSRPFAWKPTKKRKRTATGRSFQGRPGREARGYCSRKSF